MLLKNAIDALLRLSSQDHLTFQEVAIVLLEYVFLSSNIDLFCPCLHVGLHRFECRPELTLLLIALILRWIGILYRSFARKSGLAGIQIQSRLFLEERFLHLRCTLAYLFILDRQQVSLDITRDRSLTDQGRILNTLATHEFLHLARIAV